MHIEFLLEEHSAEVALKHILPKIFMEGVGYKFHVFEGKHDLFKRLPNLLKAYRRYIPEHYRIVVLVDEDREDCLELKARLESAAGDAGFGTKSNPTSDGTFQVVNRLAIEELEAWFFGDVEALRAAYPRISKNLPSKQRYKDPDAIAGGTYEELERLLVAKKYYKGRLHKPTIAGNIAPNMEPNRNRSKSFQVFIQGLKACVREELLASQLRARI